MPIPNIADSRKPCTVAMVVGTACVNNCGMTATNTNFLQRVHKRGDLLAIDPRRWTRRNNDAAIWSTPEHGDRTFKLALVAYISFDASRSKPSCAVVSVVENQQRSRSHCGR